MSNSKKYQKIEQVEHILLRPDSYVGSIDPVKESMWILDKENGKMINKEITYIPALYKIFDEILVNASDNYQRDQTMTTIKVIINQEKSQISIWNDGKGIIL